ncbi:MAG TPA: ELWxxDGT repeat protein, partial [Planctomycetota bacterium]|nr:ELWxxDGT repeat protein [Planctomycetota bacterium]
MKPLADPFFNGMFRRIAFVGILLYMAAMQPAEAGAVLVKDLRPGTTSSGSSPALFVEVNGTLFFSASTALTGSELWKSDGTAAGTILVKEIGTGSTGGFPRALTKVGGTLFFSASPDGGVSYELWKSDGTAAGTVRVASLGTNPDIGFTVAVAGKLVYEYAGNLFVSDGTEAGTVKLNSSFNNPLFPAAHNGIAFFGATGSDSISRLYKTDGTVAGTVAVKDISPSFLTSSSSGLYFSASGANGHGIYKSDGTDAGTVLLKDGFGFFNTIVDVNGSVFFVANDAAGTELWKTDGSAAGTVLVKDIFPGSLPNDPAPRQLANVNGVLFFEGNDGVNGSALWKSDGTTAGTVLVKDIVTGANGADTRNLFFNLTNVNGTLFFSAADDIVASESQNAELWKSDGTNAGTVLVKDINSSGSSSPSGLIAVGSTLFFNADDGSTGRELWKSDGTAAGTVQVKDIEASGQDSNPSTFAELNGTLFTGTYYFTNGAFTGDIWKSDGTEAGTVLVKAGLLASGMTSAAGKVFFTSSSQLYMSDGTEAGTVLANGGSTPQLLTPFNGALYYAAYGNDGKLRELRTHDGTSDALVIDLEPGNDVFISKLLGGSKLWITGRVNTFTPKLWVSNGTNAGTVELTQGIDTLEIAEVNGTLFFTKYDSTLGEQLWKTDGTLAGTVLVKNVKPTNSQGAGLYSLTSAGGTLYFVTREGELWKSDGTDAGTVFVKALESTFVLKSAGATVFLTARTS